MEMKENVSHDVFTRGVLACVWLGFFFLYLCFVLIFFFDYCFFLLLNYSSVMWGTAFDSEGIYIYGTMMLWADNKPLCVEFIVRYFFFFSSSRVFTSREGKIICLEVCSSAYLSAGVVARTMGPWYFLRLVAPLS